MEKLKQYAGYLVLAVTAIIAILAYLLSGKGKKVAALQAKVDLADTQKKADLIESEINQAKAQKDNLVKENAALEKTSASLEAKRVEIKDTQAALTDPKAVADYWNKQ
jgi:septal ring factor EnvC (AmiA/AmiB activator)